jgi:hypothetical protein
MGRKPAERIYVAFWALTILANLDDPFMWRVFWTVLAFIALAVITWQERNDG